MLPPLHVYRRQEGDFLRSGRIVLQIEDDFYDLTEALWRAEEPVMLSSLCSRGFFEYSRITSWLDHKLPAETRPISEDDILLPPFLPLEVGKILALGKNFQAHAEEFSEQMPEEPLFFNKLPETLCGHNQDVSTPGGYDARLDHEVELAVMIRRPAKDIPREKAFDYISGYSIANDLTLRTWQGADRKKKYPWFRSKNFDRACPLGPCFVPEAMLDPSKLKISASVNGELRQEASTADMAVSIPAAIEYLSHHITLNAGDIILMGTPAGVGPLEDGDEVMCEIEGIGQLRNRVRRPS